MNDASTTSCEHPDRSAGGRVCRHILDAPDSDYLEQFTGIDQAYNLICRECSKQPEALESHLVSVCAECFIDIQKAGVRDGIIGTPAVRISSRTDLKFHHETVELPALANLSILDLQPIEGSEGLWLACTSTGSLLAIDPLRGTVRTVAQVPQDALDFDDAVISESKKRWPKGPPCVLRVSRNGEVAAVANTYGEKGVLIDLAEGRVVIRLSREAYHEDVSSFPLAFAESDDRVVLIHGTEWNRLDISDARTGLLLTQRQPTAYKQDEARPEHYLDYFHCQLLVSPDQEFIADNGWVWQPFGIVTSWSLRRWLCENVWESEGGDSQKSLCRRGYYWDGPICWIDDHRLAVWGYGDDDEWLIPAVRIFDVRTGDEERWFVGPKGSLAFDEYLFSFDAENGTAVWDVTTGERHLIEQEFCPSGYHRGAKHFVSLLGDGAVRVSRLVQE